MEQPLRRCDTKYRRWIQVSSPRRETGRNCSGALLSSSYPNASDIPIAERNPTPWPSFGHDRDGETTMSPQNWPVAAA
jgi:hypothetical protein